MQKTRPHAGEPAQPASRSRQSGTRPACLALLAALAIALAACSAPEHKPGAPWHHTTEGFRNPPGSPERNPWWMRLPWLLTRPVAMAFNRTVPPPDHLVPPAEAVEGYRALAGENTLTWIGHMTALIRLDGKTVLTDPWFSDYASPFPPLGPKRYVAPGIAIADLPSIDVVLISHNHYDHLDLPSVEKLPESGRITAIMPLGLGHYFNRHSPYTIQIRGNRTTFPPPRELYPLCSHPMA